MSHKKSLSNQQEMLSEVNKQNMVRVPQSTSLVRRLNKRIIRPNAKNIASKHFPQDFFNQKTKNTCETRESQNSVPGISDAHMIKGYQGHENQRSIIAMMKPDTQETADTRGTTENVPLHLI